MVGWHVNCCGQLMPVPAALPVSAGAWRAPWADLFSCSMHQAALAQLPGTMAALYGEKTYGLRGLYRIKLLAGFPLITGGIGVSADHLSSVGYQATQLGAAYGLPLGMADLGMQFNYQQLRIDGYGTAGAIGCELATTWQVSQRLQLGVQLMNPVSAGTRGMKDAKLPYRYTTGLGYTIGEQVLMGLALVKEEDRRLDWQAALHYIPVPALLVRLGMNTEPVTCQAAVGWQYKNIRIMVTGSYRFPLGFTPGLALSFEPAKQGGL